MSTNNTDAFERFKDKLLEELQSYAGSRRNDVVRGAETPELAALIVEKYAVGGMAAIKAAVEAFNVPMSVFDEYGRIADQICLEIDPKGAENRKARWAARPAGVSKLTGLDGAKDFTVNSVS